MRANGVGGDGLEGSLVEGGTVRGEQDGGVSLTEWDDGGEHFPEMIFDLKTATFVASREGWGIEDNAVEPLFSPLKARKSVHHVVGVEAMRFRGKSIQGEIGFSSVERFSGKVYAAGFGACAGGSDRESASVGEEVQQAFWADNTLEVATVGPLVKEEASGVTCGEVEFEEEPVFTDLSLEGEGGVTFKEDGVRSLFIFFREDALKDSMGVEVV